jgi:integrase
MDDPRKSKGGMMAKKKQEGTIYLRGSTYWIKFYRAGKAFYESTHSEKISDARWLLAKRLGEKADGKPITSRRLVLISELLTDHVNDYKANHRKSVDTLQMRIDVHLLPYFGHRNASTINGGDVAAFVILRQKEGAKPATINHDLKALRRALNLGIRYGKIAAKPVIKLLRENNVRKGYFEPHQYEALRKYLPEEIQAVGDFAFITGWRKSEILSLQWRSVDFAAGRVMLESGNTKNDQARSFPITESLRVVLESQRKKTDDLQRLRSMIIPWVFHRNGRQIKTFYDTWRNACKAAKIEDRRLHDFRRTAVRNFVRAGITESVAMKLSGHETREIFERYNIVSESDIDDAAAKLEARTVTKQLQSPSSANRGVRK